MELFPAQPDLSLQISPPSNKPSSSWRSTRPREEDETLDLGFWKRALDSRNTNSTSISSNPTKGVPFSAPEYPNNSTTSNHFHRVLHGGSLNHNLSQKELSYLMTSSSRPIRGIPVYQNPPLPIACNFPFSSCQPQQQHYLDAAAAVSSSLPLTSNYNCSSSGPNYQYHHSQTLMRSRFVSSRFPGKRSMRAPRMRWTTTLHARFVHAVELLGGHERATPKSVLELMDVKDLTLAHVKSHLQMYRTVKSTDRAAATSGHSDAFENGSSGDTSDDFLFDIQNSQKSDGRQINIQNQDKDLYGLWSNSSREAWLHGRPSDRGGGNRISLEKEMEPKSLSYEDRVSEVSSSSETCPKKPNLEFTLGRPQ